jgi:hypothetical protein
MLSGAGIGCIMCTVFVIGSVVAAIGIDGTLLPNPMLPIVPALGARNVGPCVLAPLL